MRASRPADLCYGLALLTLPWVGLGVVQAVWGRDLGAGFQPAYLLLALAWLWRAAGWLKSGAGPGRRRSAVIGRHGRGLVAGSLLVAVLMLSTLGLRIAPAPGSEGEAWPRFWRQFAQVGVMAALVVYPAVWTRGPVRWRWTLRLLAVGLGLQVVYGIIQGWHHLQPVAGFSALDRVFTSNPSILAGSEELYLEGRFRGVPRLRGTVCEPLYLGSYLLLAVPWTATLARRSRAAAVLAVLGACLLVLTWSRGAWLGGIGAIIVWIIGARRAGLTLRLGPVLWASIIALAAGALVAAAIAGPDALGWPLRRLVQSWDRMDWSNLTRWYSMQAAWRAFQLSPVLGVGWGQFAFHFPLVVDPLGLQSQFTWPVVNNLPLKIVCETGIVGFVVMAALFWGLVRQSWRALRDPDPARRRRVAVALAIASGTGVQLLTFSQYNLPHLGVGLGLWLAALAGRTTAAPLGRAR